MIALIDGDIVAYQAATVAERATDWGDGLWTLHAFEEEGAAVFSTTLKGIINKVGTEDIVIALSDKDNWRKDVLPTYKSNRSGVRKPMLLPVMRQFAQDRFICAMKPTLEGDDVMGIMATKKPEGSYIICTIDKDMKTIPGKHYDFGKDVFFEVTEDEANYWHMIQTLTGDQTDGYAGCPGVGIKTAEKLLAGVPMDDRWAVVVKAFAKAGFGEEEALVQARVARILQFSDYDETTGEIHLWEPTSSMMSTAA